MTDYCDIRAKLPGQTGGFSTGSEVPAYSAVNPNCHFAPGVTTRATAAGSYTIPKILRAAERRVPEQPGHPARGELGRSRGHDCANARASAVRQRHQRDHQPAHARRTLRSERVNQLDWRVGKVLKFGRQRATISADLFNALNNDAILTYNQAFIPGGNWNVPTAVLTARTTKITVQWDF